MILLWNSSRTDLGGVLLRILSSWHRQRNPTAKCSEARGIAVLLGSSAQQQLGTGDGEGSPRRLSRKPLGGICLREKTGATSQRVAEPGPVSRAGTVQGTQHQKKQRALKHEWVWIRAGALCLSCSSVTVSFQRVIKRLDKRGLCWAFGEGDRILCSC